MPPLAYGSREKGKPSETNDPEDRQSIAHDLLASEFLLHPCRDVCALLWIGVLGVDRYALWGSTHCDSRYPCCPSVATVKQKPVVSRETD